MPAADDRRRDLRTGGLAALALLIGLAIGVLLAPSTDPEPPATPAPSPAPGPTDQPTAEPTVTDHLDGDPARTEEGAVAAALAWMQRFTPALYLDDDARRAAVADVAASSAEEELQTITANIAGNFRDAGLTDELVLDSVRLAIPVGYRLLSFSEDRAEVAVWLAQIVHLGTVSPLDANWDTQTTTMLWEDGEWRLESVTNTEGPTPEAALQGDGQLNDTIEAIEQFTEFTYEP